MNFAGLIKKIHGEKIVALDIIFPENSSHVLVIFVSQISTQNDKLSLYVYRPNRNLVKNEDVLEVSQYRQAVFSRGTLMSHKSKSSPNRSMHLINHGINVHAGANRGKYNDINGVQLVVIEFIL